MRRTTKYIRAIDCDGGEVLNTSERLKPIKNSRPDGTGKNPKLDRHIVSKYQKYRRIASSPAHLSSSAERLWNFRTASARRADKEESTVAATAAESGPNQWPFVSGPGRFGSPYSQIAADNIAVAKYSPSKMVNIPP